MDGYDIHLDDKFGQLTLIDVGAEAAAHEPWFNQTLTSVNDAVVRLGVIHSPEPYLLRSFARDGYDLVLAGHTHGGQLRIPGYGALVTNCQLDRSRARGASRWGARMWLHVSAGLGTSPYAPARFACPPEASLLTLVPRGTPVTETEKETRRKVPSDVR